MATILVVYVGQGIFIRYVLVASSFIFLYKSVFFGGEVF